MPQDGQTHKEEEWAERVLEALQLGPACETVDTQAATPPNPREIYEAEKAKLEKRLEFLVKTSQGIIDKCDVLVRKEAKAAFWKEGTRAFAVLQSVQTTMSGASSADRLDLDAISAQLDNVQSHFTKMEGICESNHADADRLINETLSRQIAEFRQTVLSGQAQRDQLEAWGLNLTRLDQRLESATELLAQITAATSAHRLLQLDELVRQAKQVSKALETALPEAVQRRERLMQDTLQKLDEIMAEAEALKGKGTELPQPSEQHYAFHTAFDQVQRAHLLAQTALQEGGYQTALSQYNQMTTQLFVMKQQMLIANVQKKHKHTILPRQSQTTKLMGQAQDLRTKLNQAASITDLIYQSSPLGAQYAQTCQSTAAVLTDVLSDLITHNKQAATDKLKIAAENLEQLKDWHAGALDNIRALREQLDQLQAQIMPWLKEPSDATQEHVQLRETQMKQLDANMKRANAYLQQNNANLARMAIAEAYQSFAQLMDLSDKGPAHAANDSVSEPES